jgi:lipoprotein-anchoring transpeptidase ErfK/SrfK
MPKVPKIFCVAALVCLPLLGEAQLFGPRRSPTPGMPQQPRSFFGQPKKATELISRQAPLKINQSVLKQATSDNVRIVVSIPKQRAYLMVGDQVAADGPVSSGKRGHETPTGKFSVLEKDPDHRSNIYGNFVDHQGRIIRAGVSSKIDSAPSGTHFEGLCA